MKGEKVNKYIGKLKKKENLFYVAYVLFLISIMISCSKYCVKENIQFFSHIIQIISCIIAMIKIVIDAIQIFKSKNYKINYFIIAICISMIISFFITKSMTLVYFPVLIMSSKDVEFKKIVKVTLVIQILNLIFMIISCKMNIIEDLIVYRENFLRHSLGSASPNCLILQVFQICMLYVLVESNEKKIYSFLILGVIASVIYFITDSRMGIFCILLLIIAYYISDLEFVKRLLDKLKIFFKALPILLASVVIVLTFLHKTYNLEKLDIVSTSRLQYSSEAVEKYGIKLFGNKIVWIGQRTDVENDGSAYNYVDSSYLNILLNFGVVVFAFILYCLVRMTESAYKNQNYLLVLLIAIMEVYCFLDSWLMGMQFNTILFTLSEIIYPLKLKK